MILSWNISIVTSTIENVSIDTCITENRAKSVLRIYAEGFNVKQAIPTRFLKNKKNGIAFVFSNLMSLLLEKHRKAIDSLKTKCI